MNQLRADLTQTLDEMYEEPTCWMAATPEELTAVMAAASLGISEAEKEPSVAARIALTTTCRRWYSAAHESRLACESAGAGYYLILQGPLAAVNAEAAMISWLLAQLAQSDPHADMRAIRRFQQRVEATGFSRC